jgi:hypothetical protein
MATAMMVNTTTIAKNKPRMSIGMPLGVMALAAARTDLPERIALKTMSAILNAIESDYYLYSNLMLRSSNSQKKQRVLGKSAYRRPRPGSGHALKRCDLEKSLAKLAKCSG